MFQIPKSTDNTLGVCESHRLGVELIFFEQDTGVPKLIGKTFVKLLDIVSVSDTDRSDGDGTHRPFMLTMPCLNGIIIK